MSDVILSGAVLQAKRRISRLTGSDALATGSVLSPAVLTSPYAHIFKAQGAQPG